MMKRTVFSKIIASFAICGLALWSASPALAGSQYDPNDQYYDPSGTYVAPAPTDTVDPAASTNSGDSQTTNPSSGDNSQTTATTDQNIQPADSQEIAVDPNNSNVSTQDSQSDGTAVTDGSDTNTSDPVASNSNTGTGSDNDANISTENNSQTDVDNNANVNNPVTGSANSGQNSANMNSGNGGVATGDADLAANIITAANTIVSGASSFALPVINILSNLIGDLVLGSSDTTVNPNDLNLQQIVSNYLTGPSSDNTANANTENNNSTDLNNTGNLNNNLNLSANSGQNSTNMNTGDGNITTGNANIASNVVNFLNNTIFATNWWMGIVNIFGDWTGNLIAPSLTGSNSGSGTIDQTAINSGTGAYSDNNAVSRTENNSDTNITNDANMIDNVTFNANTGGNQAKGNTGDGQISTGDANIKDNELTVANNTITGGTWWMMLVNTLDGWAGAIIGSPDGGTQFLPFLFGNTATNTETGPFSDNSAISNSENNNTTDITNQANTNNTLNLSANTGDNQANYNTGNGSISTGDANIMSNLVNFVNNTFNVQNWAFGIINVFGRWTGGVQFGADAASNPDTDVIPESLMSTAVNDATGAGSDNSAVAITDQDQNLTIDNNLSVQKNLNLNANTGRNDTDFNTGNGLISTGDIDAEVGMATFGNITQIGLPGVGTIVATSGNSDTGAGSDNNAFVGMFNKFKIVVNNTANFVKNVTGCLNTGDNSSSMNTGSAEIDTGNVKFSLVEEEVLNIFGLTLGEKPVCQGETCQNPGGGEEEQPTEIESLSEFVPGMLPIAGENGIVISLIGGILAAFAIRRKSL